MLTSEFIEKIKYILGKDSVKLDEPMKDHTSFKIGGPAEIFLIPKTLDEITQLIKLCTKFNVEYMIIGNATNLIVRDNGIKGAVIKLADNFNNYKVMDDIISAQTGILLSDLAIIALQNSLSGIEFACGIPGTLGGAVTMNAGAYGSEFKDIVLSTEYMDGNGDIFTIDNEQHRFGYRTSFIQTEKFIALKSNLKLKKDNKDNIEKKMDELNSKRKQKQPLDMPSAGSVFKRPEGYFTGELIEKCGLKGYKIGGAMVSDLHSGFIVNERDATAKDVIDLIHHIQKTVKSKFNVDLKTEVKIVGH